MHFSKAIFLQALLVGTGLARQEKRQIGTAQNCLANIQLAQLGLQNAVSNLNLNVPQTAQVIPQQFAAIENAMNLGLIQLQNTGVLSNADAQLLLASTNSLGSSLQLATMGLIIQQPALDQFGLVPVSLQTLQNQRALVNQLGQVVVARVPPDTVGSFQTGFGQALSSLDFGVAQLQGGGVVGVQVSQGGLVPTQGVSVISQDCAAIGFAPINGVVGVDGIGVSNQQALIQQCGAVGFVPISQVQVFQQALGQQQLINQCAAVGFVPTNVIQGQFIQQDLANQCAAIGFVPVNQAQGQVNQADVLNQCAQIGFVQPSGMAMNGQQIVGQLVSSQMVGGASVQQVSGQNLQGQDQLVQQCLAIGFVQANQGQQQFVASPQQCAAFGLVQQGNNQQGVAQQCAALGFQPSDAVNQQAVAQLEQQLGINQGQNVAIQSQAAQGQNVAAQSQAAQDQNVAAESQAAQDQNVAAESQAAQDQNVAAEAEATQDPNAAAESQAAVDEEEEEMKMKRQATEAATSESAIESATAAAVTEAAQATEAQSQATQVQSQATQVQSQAIQAQPQATQVQQGVVSAQQCAQLGFVQVNAGNVTAAQVANNATATDAAADVAAERMVRRRRRATFKV